MATTTGNTTELGTLSAALPAYVSRAGLVLCTSALVLVALAAGSMMFGRYPISLQSWWDALARPDRNEVVRLILLQVRLPRVLAGILVGGGLSLAGAAYQGLFKNPMVSPDILGASAGAGFGAAVGILFGFGIGGIQALSFVCGLAAVLLAWALAAGASRSGDPILMLVLIGILVASVFTALISLVKFVADPYSKLPPSLSG